MKWLKENFSILFAAVIIGGAIIIAALIISGKMNEIVNELKVISYSIMHFPK